MKVNGRTEWDEELLDELFNPTEKDWIMKTPISPNYEDDWYWRFDMKGSYTVRSAYRSLCSNAGHNGSSDFDHWKVLWKLKIPSKLKFHWWRIIKGIIPVRDILSRRGIEIDSTCPLCTKQTETIRHLFLDCSFTQGVWRACNLQTSMEGSSPMRLVSTLASRDSNTLCKIAWVLWFVWRARNNVVWRGARWNMVGICKQVLEAFEEGRSSSSHSRAGSVSGMALDESKGWEPPERGWRKCNVDAALFWKENKVGYGLVLRDDQARFVATKGGSLPCILDPGTAEMYACKEALSWVRTKGFSNVIIESDCAQAINILQGKVMDSTYKGRISMECMALSTIIPGVRFNWVRRDDNSCAHTLARESINISGNGEWSDQPPICISAFFTR